MVATTVLISTKKLVIGKKKYFICLATFYAIIACGLIWQLTQISMNFLKYKVVSDIKILIPEADNDTYHSNMLR